jgi:hypothetical protein
MAIFKPPAGEGGAWRHRPLLPSQERSMNPDGVHTRQPPAHRKMLNMKRLYDNDSDKIWTMAEYWTIQAG